MDKKITFSSANKLQITAYKLSYFSKIMLSGYTQKKTSSAKQTVEVALK